MATTTYKQPKKVANAPATSPLKINELDVSTAFVDKSNQSYPTKTTGIVTRGNGCAVRGKTARGPMA